MKTALEIALEKVPYVPLPTHEPEVLTLRQQAERILYDAVWKDDLIGNKDREELLLAIETCILKGAGEEIYNILLIVGDWLTGD